VTLTAETVLFKKKEKKREALTAKVPKRKVIHNYFIG